MPWEHPHRVVEGLLATVVSQMPSVMHRYEQAPLSTAFHHLLPCLHPGARVLDIGCGSGWVLGGLASLGATAIGIDVDGRRLREGDRSPLEGSSGWAHRIAADATRLPFPDRSFDAVFSLSVLQYTDWRSTLAECRRVLRDGGRAVFIENLHGHPLARLYRAARRTFWPYQRNLVPRQHIRWSDLGAFTEIFGFAEARAHALFTPALAIPEVVLALPRGGAAALETSPHREGNGAALGTTKRLAFDLLEAVDNALLRRWAMVGRHAWLATVTCINGHSSS